jgi:hypothetical protein
MSSEEFARNLLWAGIESGDILVVNGTGPSRYKFADSNRPAILADEMIDYLNEDRVLPASHPYYKDQYRV